MNSSPYYTNQFNYNLNPGDILTQTDQLNLADGSQVIQGILIYNNSALTVNVYQGSQQAQGGPTNVVPPYTQRAFLASCNYAALTYMGTAGIAGNIEVQWSNQPMQSMATTIPTPATIKIPIWSSANDLSFTTGHAGDFQDAGGWMMNNGQTLYLTDLYFLNFESESDTQKILWSIKGLNAITNMVQDEHFFWGDIQFNYTEPTPLYTSSAENGDANGDLIGIRIIIDTIYTPPLEPIFYMGGYIQ